MMSYYRFHMTSKKGRYSRRYLSIICTISFLIILMLISVQIYRRQLNGSGGDDGRDRPAYCNQSILQKFYMHDRKYFSLIN
jgi:hypothetical protein